MTRPLAAALLAPALLLAACGDDGPSFVESGDTAGGDTANASDSGGVDIPADGSPVARNPQCAAPTLDDTTGTRLPWHGFTHEGATYTCNGCPNGDRGREGRWRHIDGQTLDPDTPLDDDYQELLVFSGNTWSFVSSGIDVATGSFEEQAVSGWYFCGVKPEIGNEATVLVATDVANEGAFGWTTGLVFSADVLIDLGGTGLNFWWYEGLNTGPQTQDIYCRVGTDIITDAGEQKACTDPFAK